MSTRTLDALEVIEQLPSGEKVWLEDVGWDEYDSLLSQLGESPSLRISYDQGNLEVMSPLPEHEEYKSFIHDLARALAEELRVNLEMRGSATFRRFRDSRGVEPDESFYVQNAAAVIGKRKIDLSVDPPPDVVVEIDLTSDSSIRFPIFAALRVPEVWRYDGVQARIYRLGDLEYHEVSDSSFFRLLTADALTQFIEQSKTQGQTAALASFRHWVRARQH